MKDDLTFLEVESNEIDGTFDLADLLGWLELYF